MASRIIMAILVLAVVAAIAFSDRNWALTNMPRVEPIATLPEKPELQPVRRDTEIGSDLLPYASERSRDAVREPGALRLGYSYREVSLFGMPFWAYEEFGLVTYLEKPGGYQIGLLNPAKLRIIEDAAGRPYSGHVFALHRHLWGWLLVIGFIAWFVARRREDEKRRQKSGII
jgi:hypothetical protein